MLYGRDPERAQIGALLEGARSSRSGALVVRGEPGIGKSALLEDTRARAVDMHVLTARGVESESELPFAVLHQLLRPALGYVERLPAAQAKALRGALGMGEGAAEERFLVFAACLTLLSELAERRPVLCLVDDAHWLDAASADALRFVARRLDAEGIVILFVAKQALSLVEDPALRADLAHVRALAAVRCGRPHDIVPMLVDAAREVAPVDPAKAMQLLVDAADAVWQGGDRAGYLDITQLAATVVPPAGDETSAAFARSLAGFAAMINGDTSEGVRFLGEVAAWGAAADEPRHVVWASFGAQWLGDEERFGALIDRAASLARERGELGILADALGMRAGKLAFEQRFDQAAVAASEAVQLARELKADNLELYPLAALAIVSAVRGRDEEARRHAENVLELATANGLPLRASMAVYALALVDLGRARWADALERLDSLLERGSGALDPMVGIMIPDKIEAAVRASRPEEARAALPLFEAWVAYSGALSAPARLAACRALLAGSDKATEHFEEALRFSSDARPFDLARIRLLYGEHLRRERRRVDARVQLRAALEAFDGFRADPWAERARTELRASGETARKRDPSTSAQLTPQELQIARFVAEGLSNKEVAAQLFLSPRTIDAHLRNVFAKLGITSRTQLARLPLGEEEPLAMSA